MINGATPPSPPSPTSRPYDAARAPSGRGETPLSPYDDRPFGEIAEPFRHRALSDTRTPSTWRSRTCPRGAARLAQAAAIAGLALGIALAHGLLIASGLVLAGLAGHLSTESRARRR
ncbi:hypothetical protein [Streptomyces sp. NPDC059008]|uniref:hypothetical protein n=1 Tax=Streptomyces sp. NPDC059008 TaxID=3346693 RepID=UPI0036BF5D51